MFDTNRAWLGQVSLVARPSLGTALFSFISRAFALQKIDQAEAGLAKAEDFITKHPEIAGNTLWVSYNKFVDLHKKAQDGLPFAENLKAVPSDAWVDLNQSDANLLDAWWKDAVDLGNLTGAAAVFYAPPTPSGVAPSPGTSTQPMPTTNLPMETPKGSTVPLIVGGGIAAAGALALLTLAGRQPLSRSPWLSQVPLAMGPSLGTTVGVVMPKFARTPPADAQPPENGAGCVFLGGREPFSAAGIDMAIKDAQALGYTDIHEIDVPPCDPTKDPFQCQIVGGNPPQKYVWACPPKSTAPSSPPAGAAAAPTSPSKTPLIVGGGIAAAGAIALLTLAGPRPMARSPWLGQVPLAQ